MDVLVDEGHDRGIVHLRNNGLSDGFPVLVHVHHPSLDDSVPPRIGNVVIESKFSERIDPSVSSDLSPVFKALLLSELPIVGLIPEIPLQTLIRLDVVVGGIRTVCP